MVSPNSFLGNPLGGIKEHTEGVPGIFISGPLVEYLLDRNQANFALSFSNLRKANLPVQNPRLLLASPYWGRIILHRK